MAVLPDTDMAGAVGWAHRLRDAMAAQQSPRTGPVTVSIGIAVWRPGERARHVLARADEAMYTAKRAGRDRVVADGVGIVPPPPVAG